MLHELNRTKRRPDGAGQILHVALRRAMMNQHAKRSSGRNDTPSECDAFGRKPKNADLLVGQVPIEECAIVCHDQARLCQGEFFVEDIRRA